jgi:hypothetical protein
VTDKQAIIGAILHLCALRSPKTICPSEVARFIFSDELAWRAAMPKIRVIATELAVQSKIDILQKGVVVKPDGHYRGAIRLRWREPYSPL